MYRYTNICFEARVSKKKTCTAQAILFNIGSKCMTVVRFADLTKAVTEAHSRNCMLASSHKVIILATQLAVATQVCF